MNKEDLKEKVYLLAIFIGLSFILIFPLVISLCILINGVNEYNRYSTIKNRNPLENILLVLSLLTTIFSLALIIIYPIALIYRLRMCFGGNIEECESAVSGTEVHE